MARVAKLKEEKDNEQEKIKDMSGLDENGKKKGILKELEIVPKDLVN
jgi:hypothetical protein